MVNEDELLLARMSRALSIVQPSNWTSFISKLAIAD